MKKSVANEIEEKIKDIKGDIEVAISHINWCDNSMSHWSLIKHNLTHARFRIDEILEMLRKE